MAIEKINIEKFLELATQFPVIDVRSPGEFNHAQFPGAYPLPLFTDEERKIVGTAYKQQIRQSAIKIGLTFFGVKMKNMVDDVEKIIADRKIEETVASNNGNDNLQTSRHNTVLVHCWRGGMRSGAVAWLLDLYGFKVYTLNGGYKLFRRWTLEQFDKPYKLKILGGYTKGSAFGAIGENPQPSQEMFENLLALQLFTKTSENKNLPEIWLEDESQRIGKVIIPNAFWETMRDSPVYFLDIPFNERLNFLVDTYGNFEKEKLAEAIDRIQKRLGGLETKNAQSFLSENNTKECFRILLHYYDKLYSKGLTNRKNYQALLNIIPCTGVSSSVNINKLSLHKV
jgi:tRNA 2-selenouridine synthase